MESPPGSSDWVAYPGNKAENKDQGQPLEQKSLSENKDSIEDAITSHVLKVKTGLQLGQVRLSDRYVLEVQQVQQLNKASDFTVTDRDKNVTTNTSQESTEMSTSTKDEMVLCSEETQKQALEKKKLRTEAIAFICAQTQARLARFGALSEEISLCRTSEQYHYYPNDSNSLSIPHQVPTELSIPSTVTMEPVQASKKKKKKKSKKKPKKRVPLDIGSIDSLNMRELNQASLSARVPSVQSSSEEAPSSDGPSCLTQSQDLSESSPSLYLQESNLKTKHLISADLGKDFAAPCTTQYKNRLQVEGKDTTECHEGCSMERVLSTGPCEQTYRDALLGTMDHRDKRRVSGTDPTTKDDIAEHNAALHAHPTPLAIEEWPSITGQTPAGRDTRDTSPKAASSIDSVQDEEVSNTGSSTRAQPSRLGHSTRKNKASSRERLPPIQEATSETAQGYPHVKPPSPHAERGSMSSEVQSHLTCTPKSSKSTSTGWTSAEPQGTPQTESSEIDNIETNDHQKISTETRTVVISQTKGSHAHPSSSLSLERPGQCATAAQKYISTQKPEGFFWQLDSHGFPCAKAECEKRCNLWDGATVICPRCGPFSEIRYCCKEHLLEDIKYHWLYCGQMTFEHPCRENSIPRDVRDGPLLVPCLHPYDTPERHRQAVYFNAKVREGDYFIFSDWTDLVKAGFPENNVEVRCSSRVIYTIRFEDASEKDRFRRVLATCLFMTIEVTELVDYLFRLIRDKLRSLAAPIELEATLKYQFQQEFCVTIQPHITGERHACVTDWDGRNRRNCQDAICRAEYRRLLGSLGGKGHCQLIDHLEGSYWILRAVRTTHPGVSDAKARMCGDGFSDVADEDRREFRRGAGWDGAGTGDMEIEGINDD